MKTGPFFATTLILIVACTIALSGCGSDAPGETPSDVLKSTGPLMFRAPYEGLELVLVVPAAGEAAETLRHTMSQAPPYLVGSLTVYDTGLEAVEISAVTPILTFDDGTDNGSAVDRDRQKWSIDPGSNVSGLYIFGHTDTGKEIVKAQVDFLWQGELHSVELQPSKPSRLEQ